ncbi:MAG: RagB/SusD family nutrient uptake outer membrane protein [Muribaculaceae bacterium]
MKRYFKITTSLIVSALLLTSCSDVFDDLAVNPNQPSMTEYFTTPQGANSAVMTMYGYIQTQRCFGASASKAIIIRSDEASSNSDYGKVGMYGSSLNSSFYTIMQPYGLLFSTASQACYILENIDKITFADQKQKNAYKGEAYFWRAFAHYYLLMNYRQFAPIRHMPTGAQDYARKNESPAKIWEFINSDLQSAKELLPNKGYWTGANIGRLTAASAAALKGKCYLYRSGVEQNYGEDKTTFYSEAANEFDEIIKGTYGAYTLVEYSQNFDVAHENNDESILELQFLGDVENTAFNPGQATSGLAFDTRGIMLPGTGVGYEGVVHDWLYKAFVNSIDKDGYTDIRMFATMLFNDKKPEVKLRPGQRLTGPGGYHFEDYYPKGDFTTVNNVRTHVYKAAFLKGLDLSLPMRNNTPTNLNGVGGGTKEFIYNQPRAHGVNWRYIRYADVLLMYAESVLMGGKQGTKSAAEAYNEVRTRANMPTKGSITLNDIKDERVLEFALEGHRYFDLLRWGDLSTRFITLQGMDSNFKRLISDNDYEGFKINKHEWLPIPIAEMDSNPFAVQNPGY